MARLIFRSLSYLSTVTLESAGAWIAVTSNPFGVTFKHVNVAVCRRCFSYKLGAASQLDVDR